MAVFIELTTDAFESNFQRQVAKKGGGAGSNVSMRAGLSNVRRPLRGIEVKEDTYGLIKVIAVDGSEIPLINSSVSTGFANGSANFIIQSIQEARMEKHQIIETFGQPYVYFFGESPRFLDVQAILINSHDFNWEAEWWDNWEKRLRGTRSVELGARTYLFYDDSIVEGYMLMAQASKTSDQQFVVQMNFRMFVSNHKNISFVGDPNFPIHASVNLPPNIALTDGDAFTKLNAAFLTEGRAQNAALAYDDEVNSISGNDFGARGRLTDALRRGTRSIAFAPGVQSIIDTLQATNAQDLPELDTWDRLNSKPIRSKISDNDDEYTGGSSIAPDFMNGDLPEVYQPRVRDTLEVQDLFLSAIRWMGCFGADIDNYSALSGIGLGLTFNAGTGVGIGRGTGVSMGATFGATATAGYGFSTGYEAGASAGLNANGSVSSSASQDVFFGSGELGRSAQLGSTVGLDTSYGDAAYGYASAYGGVGFGVSGFGDLGGKSFGSAFGEFGDPGYIAPDRFTFAGVDDERDAFERFTQPKRTSGSGIGGIGLGDSFAGVGVGAGVQVGGYTSAFAMVAVPGTLDVTGQSRPQQQLLTDPNPFGLPCLDSSGSNGVNLLDLI